jgi:hypothetical protein
MTWEQFREWEIFEELEPFETERADYRSAHVIQTLWNIARDPRRHPDGWPLSDFVLTFGDSPRLSVAQTLETQVLLIESWIAGSNAVFAIKEGQDGR